MRFKDLPVIGQPLYEEKPALVPLYTGLSVEKEQPVALVLLPGEATEITWSDAQAWAKEKGGTLPSRIDALVLFQNLRKHFKEVAYWTDTPYADDESFAWGQHFDNGYQASNRKNGKLRAVAVRRIPLEGDR